MNIVIDSNILFSALIKDSITRKLILNYNGLFLFPEYIFEEIEEHKAELFEKSEMNKEDFNLLLSLILKKVLIVNNEILLSYKQQAVDIVKDIDLDDALFIACALAYSDSILWSDDKALKKQDKVKVFNTHEIIEILNI